MMKRDLRLTFTALPVCNASDSDMEMISIKNLIASTYHMSTSRLLTLPKFKTRYLIS